MDEKPTVYPGTQAVTRAVSLLKSFSDSHPEWQLNELADANGLNRTTVYRLLATLEREGLVSRRSNDRVYCLGPEMIALGGCALRSHDLRTVARPILQALAESSGEAATLEVMTDRQVIVIDETSGQHLVGMSQDVGTRLPVHATSTGKVLLAYGDDDLRTKILSAPLVKVTEHTIDSVSALRADMKMILERGYAVATDELEIGFVAIAAPVFDHEEQAIAAISVGGPTLRIQPARVEVLAMQVVDAANRISHHIGYRPT